jgi:hypothetical protein
MLVGGDPLAVLAFTAGRTVRVLAVHALRDPAREFEPARARVLVDEDAVRESSCANAASTSCRRGGTTPAGASRSSCAHRCQAERVFQRRQGRAADVLEILRGVDDAETLWRCTCQFQVAVAYPVEELC